MSNIERITPFLWFDSQAEEAVQFYTSVFKNSRIVKTIRYTDAGKKTHKRPAGSVMTIEFEIEGQTFTALNGGPEFKLNEAVSFVIKCQNQAEIDSYWQKLTPGSDPKSHICGWLKDKYGLSWQVVPVVLPDLLGDSDTGAAARTMEALLKMKKLDIEALKHAHAGETVGVRV